MKQSVLIAVSVAALTLAGCSKSEDKTAGADTTAVTTADGTSAVAVVGPDQAFVDAVAASDAFELQSSQLVVSKGSAGPIRRFADAMIKSQGDATSKLNAAATAATPAISPQLVLSATQKQQLDAMTTLSGAAFETAYKQAQVEAHEATLNTLKSYAQNGGQASLKSYAAGAIPMVTAHLNMAKGL